MTRVGDILALNGVITIKRVAEELQIGEPYARSMVSTLFRDGRLMRLTRGQYWMGVGQVPTVIERVYVVKEKK